MPSDFATTTSGRVSPFTRACGTANSSSQPLEATFSLSDTSRSNLSGALLTASAATSHISRSAPSRVVAARLGKNNLAVTVSFRVRVRLLLIRK